ncbi:MAG TPA: cytochrome c oxidase assembly protein [Galbitalea sp.]|nr:cytochrome c oxidase assembly protein [Galbitalea sp.]
MIRVSRVVGPAVVLLVAFAALLASLAYGGGATAPAAIDPGQVVLYGLPIANLLVILSASGLVGSLVLAVFAFSSAKPEYGRALDVASASAAILAVSSAATTFFNLQTIYPEPVEFDSQFGATLSTYLTGNPLGQAWLATTLIAAVLTVVFFVVRNQTVVALFTIVAILSLIPMSLQGHSGDTSSHSAATTSIYLHVVFAALWLGGLLTIILCRKQLEGGRIATVIERYSSLALICFVVVAISGLVNAEIRIGPLENLLTPYGILVLVKVFAIGALGIFGVFQRRFLIGRLSGNVAGLARYFWIFVAGELAFMGLASGVAVALSRTVDPELAVPASELSNPTPAEILTGSHLPAPPTIERYLTGLNPDLLWALLVAFGLFFYLAGVRRLRQRGDKWPIHRTILWISGMAVLLYVTSGGVNVYEEYLFSAHMIEHMVLTMAVPVLLVPSAPITLALRAINKREDGSRGAREWILLAVHSRVFTFLSQPLVAALLFASSLWIFYYTPLFSWASTDHVGHEWMIFHFLIVGYLFVSSLIGVDPSPARPSYPLRLLILLATMAFHAFFGLALITSTGLLSADWYGAMGWGPSIPALEDQQTAGGIAWGIGEIPTLALAILVAFMWSRSDARESRRYDRKADRDGDAELGAYNEMLARRARQSGEG